MFTDSGAPGSVPPLAERFGGLPRGDDKPRGGYAYETTGGHNINNGDVPSPPGCLKTMEADPAVKAISSVRPTMPSRDEVSAFHLAHQQYIIWCKRCAKGRAGELRHVIDRVERDCSVAPMCYARIAGRGPDSHCSGGQC